MKIEIKSFYGSEISDWINLVGEMRISQFKKSPYFYAGNMDIERQYLSFYSSHKESVLVVALNDNNLIGIITGIPLHAFKNADKFEQALNNMQKSADNFYYIGESIVLPEFQRRGIMKLLYKELTNHVSKLNYKYLCYIDLEGTLGSKYGFVNPGIVVPQTWSTIQSDGKIAVKTHDLLFWMRHI